MAVDDPAPPVSGWAFIALGVFLAAFGGLVLALDDGPPKALGYALLGAGSLVSTIGAVAVGVTMGILRADLTRRQVEAGR